MLLIYVSAGVVLLKYLGAESLCKFKFLLSVCMCACACVCVTLRSPCRADRPSRGVVPNVESLECDLKAWTVRRPWPTTGCCAMSCVCVRVCVFVRFGFIVCRFYDWPLCC